MLARELAYRGHITAAYDALGTNIGPLEEDSFGLLAAMGGVPNDTAAAVFARLLHDRSVWVGSALPWWASRGDTASLLTGLARADSGLTHATSSVMRRDWNYRTAEVRAYLSLARHSSDAATRFQQLPDTLCMGCYLDRITKAKLFDSLGKRGEAEALLAERPHSLLTPLEVVAANARAAVAEKLQHYETASRDYEFVARAWATGDGAHHALAVQASSRAGQLGGDQPERGRLSPDR
jgi:hypothetical protein